MRPDSGANSGHPTEIGRRHSIRVVDGSGFRDLLGTLTSATQITKRDGSTIEFDPGAIVAWRAIDELTTQAGRGAPTSMRIAQLEELSTVTWPAAQSFLRGGWLYRISEGASYRSNSALLVGLPDFADPLLPLDDELDYLIETFQKSSLLPTIHLPLPRYEAMDKYLDRLGWQVAIDGQVMVADKPAISAQTDHSYSVHTFDQPSAEFQSVRASSDACETMARYPARYICIYGDDGHAVATGRIATWGDWAMLTALFVPKAARGRGWSKVLIRELLAQSPATKVALQVDRKNFVALSLYSAIGFKHHHDYRFRTWGEGAG
jgi:GNAT superfamily N-acetyltransferase